MAGRVRVYIATSLDGFLAGPNDELDWLPPPSPAAVLPPGALAFDDFFREIGAMVMGRRTYDVVSQMGGDWFYGDTPVLVPTHRPLTPVRPSVQAVSGPISDLLDQALALAQGRDVYLDGGETIRAALEADRVDALVVTVLPILLGQGKSLFAGLSVRVPLQIAAHVDYGGGMIQLHLHPANRPSSP